MNKVLMYGGSLVALGAIGLLAVKDPVKGGIAALILLGLIVLAPKIKRIDKLKVSKDEFEIDADSKDDSK
jgi:hypothetical protein